MNINFEIIGKKIKYYRKKNKISQMELAEYADLSVPYVSFIETGKKKVSLSSLVKIAAALGVTPNHILTDYILHSGDTIETEITTLLKGCSADEQRFLREMMVLLLQFLRTNKWFLNRNKD